MKTAVIHNVLNVRGGAEKVAIILARAFRADFFTLIYEQEKTFEEAKKLKKIIDLRSFRLPKKRIFYPWIYPFFDTVGAAKFLALDLNGYDSVITSGRLGLFATGEKTIHYSHSPFLHDLRQKVLEYLEKSYGVHAKLLAAVWLQLWEQLDRWAIQRPDVIITNSNQLKERIEKYYGREPLIVYPPVETDKFKAGGAEDYFLAVQRPNPEKRPEMLLEIFRRLPEEKLILVGDYIDVDYTTKLGRLVSKSKNVRWLKGVSQKGLVDLYSHCKAVIQVAESEGFGLVAVEAMASGKPVLAVDDGGFKETILDGKTGILVKKPHVQNFLKVIRNFDSFDFSPEACVRRAEMFSKEKFINKMKEVVKNV